jgi:exopolyphosphatase/guanosine-5'-triphosphate,3'-diphosphate pyrophosphatase
MRIAAIDIGTNSVHMIVVQVRPDLSFEVIDREKAMVRLGAGGLGGKALTPEAMTAARQALSKFRRLAESHRVDELRAAATSAVREAENGGEFLADIERHTGIRAQVISGLEEAQLIHRAALYAVDAGTQDVVVVDIGGGSVEITLGSAAGIRLARSVKLGVIRLTERFVTSDPLSRRDERKLVAHITEKVGDHLAAIAEAGFARVVGTSGTIQSLGIMAHAAEFGRTPDEVRNLRIQSRAVHRLRKTIVEADTAARLELPGLDPRRADLIVAGTVLFDTIIRTLGASEFTLCDFALREGLVLDYIARNRNQIAQIDRYPDVRRRSVVELCERCRYGPEHAQQVARLAVLLFDQTRAVHGLTDREREWLEYAALMHDIGEHISYSRHHKHSYYLIKNGDLRGFEPDEIDIMALVARYHRSARPKKSHEAYRNLPRSDRTRVRALAAILRLAEGFERSHAQVVSGLELQDRGRDYLLKVRVRGDAELELWAAHRQAAPFEALVGKPVYVTADGIDHAEHAHDAAPVPRQAVRRGGHRRIRQDDATVAAGQVAQRRGPAGVRHRMELVGARQGRHQGGQEKERADADDVQPAARHRLR